MPNNAIITLMPIVSIFVEVAILAFIFRECPVNFHGLHMDFFNLNNFIWKVTNR